MATRIDEINIDVTLSERHSGRVALTVHPIEKGMNPTDHARLEPARYSLEGLFSNLPLPSGRGQVKRDATDTFVKKQSDRLWQLLAKREAITVQTELKKYENMVLTSLDMPRDPAMGDVVQFSAQFDEVRFVEVGRTQFANTKTSVPEQPTQKKKQAKKQPSPSSEKDTSIAKGLLNSFGFTESGSGSGLGSLF